MFSAWKMGSMWHMPKWSLMCIQFKKLLRTHFEERVSFTNLRCQSWEISQGWNQKGLWLDLARTTNCNCWWSISKSFDLKRARASGVRRLMTLWLRFLESWLVRALIWSPSLASNQTRVLRNIILQWWWWPFWNQSSIGWRDEGIPIKTKEISSQVRIKQRIKQRFRQRHRQRKSNKQEGLIWLIIHVILIVFEFHQNWYQSIKWMRLLSTCWSLKSFSTCSNLHIPLSLQMWAIVALCLFSQRNNHLTEF